MSLLKEMWDLRIIIDAKELYVSSLVYYNNYTK